MILIFFLSRGCVVGNVLSALVCSWRGCATLFAYDDASSSRHAFFSLWWPRYDGPSDDDDDDGDRGGRVHDPAAPAAGTWARAGEHHRPLRGAKVYYQDVDAGDLAALQVRLGRSRFKWHGVGWLAFCVFADCVAGVCWATAAATLAMDRGWPPPPTHDTNSFASPFARPVSPLAISQAVVRAHGGRLVSDFEQVTHLITPHAPDGPELAPVLALCDDNVAVVSVMWVLHHDHAADEGA